VRVAVREKDYRSAAKLLFQAVGIQLRLALADAGVLFGPLCFDYCEGQSVIAPKQVVNETLSGSIRHSRNFEFTISRFVKQPPGFT
jgi:hypothetical protein